MGHYKLLVQKKKYEYRHIDSIISRFNKEIPIVNYILDLCHFVTMPSLA